MPKNRNEAAMSLHSQEATPTGIKPTRSALKIAIVTSQ
jgi:hypothetical protein